MCCGREEKLIDAFAMNSVSKTQDAFFWSKYHQLFSTEELTYQ